MVGFMKNIKEKKAEKENAKRDKKLGEGAANIIQEGRNSMAEVHVKLLTTEVKQLTEDRNTLERIKEGTSKDSVEKKTH